MSGGFPGVVSESTYNLAKLSVYQNQRILNVVAVLVKSFNFEIVLGGLKDSLDSPGFSQHFHEELNLFNPLMGQTAEDC